MATPLTSSKQARRMVQAALKESPEVAIAPARSATPSCTRCRSTSKPCADSAVHATDAGEPGVRVRRPSLILLMRSTRHLLKSWLPLCIWMAVIFIASTDRGSPAHTSIFIDPFLHWLLPNASADTLDRVHLLIRKLAHLAEYATLGLVLFRALDSTCRSVLRDQRWKIAGLAFGIAALYAASDEFHQSFVPSRHASAVDVLIDTCGAMLGIGMVFAFGKRTADPEGLI
jgi:VanZ family protein